MIAQSPLYSRMVPHRPFIVSSAYLSLQFFFQNPAGPSLRNCLELANLQSQNYQEELLETDLA